MKDRNVYENVAFAQRVIERPNRVIKKRVPEILTLVGLAEKYKSFPRELSGGEQQRVALARALVNRPRRSPGIVTPIAASVVGYISREVNFR